MHTVRPRVFASRRFPARVREELERSFELDLHDSEWPLEREELLRRVAGKRRADADAHRPRRRRAARRGRAAAPDRRQLRGRASNNVDLEACRRRGVVVSNTPDVLTETTAELTIALMLALLRRVAEGDRLIRRGEEWIWAPNLMLGRGLAGLTLGLVGHGRIGQAVERLARRPRHERRLHRPRSSGMPLDELLATADVVSLHLPLHGRVAPPDRRRRARPDEADRRAREHQPRPDRRRGGARRRARRGPRSPAPRSTSSSTSPRCTPACSVSRTSSSSPTSARRPRRRARRWGCSASRRCVRCCSRTARPRTPSARSRAGGGRATAAPARAAPRPGISVASSAGRPTSWTPIGRPSSLQKSGTDTAGRPVMFATWVNGVNRPALRELPHGSSSSSAPIGDRRLRERRRQQQVVVARGTRRSGATSRAAPAVASDVVDRVRLRRRLDQRAVHRLEELRGLAVQRRAHLSRPS